VKTKTPSKSVPMSIEVQESPVHTQSIPVHLRDQMERFVWPDDKPLPQYHQKREPMPCPACRRVRLDDLGQATVCNHSGGEVAWYRCKSCGHRWQMPVRS
jgi:hypothetical protein